MAMEDGEAVKVSFRQLWDISRIELSNVHSYLYNIIVSMFNIYYTRVDLFLATGCTFS